MKKRIDIDIYKYYFLYTKKTIIGFSCDIGTIIGRKLFYILLIRKSFY